MSNIPFITELNSTKIYAKRAECTKTGRNIDDALSEIDTNVMQLQEGEGVSIAQSGSNLVISATEPSGPCGPRGLTGFCGPLGASGVSPKGFCGPRGFAPCGPSGYKGFCGPRGSTGPCGPHGSGFKNIARSTWSSSEITLSSSDSTLDTWNRTSSNQNTIAWYHVWISSGNWANVVITVRDLTANTSHTQYHYLRNGYNDAVFLAFINRYHNHRLDIKYSSASGATKVKAYCNYFNFNTYAA